MWGVSKGMRFVVVLSLHQFVNLIHSKSHYLTRARSEPTSDPVKPLIGQSVNQSITGFVHATSEKLLDRFYC